MCKHYGRSCVWLIGHYTKMVGKWPMAGCYFAHWQKVAMYLSSTNNQRHWHDISKSPWTQIDKRLSPPPLFLDPFLSLPLLVSTWPKPLTIDTNYIIATEGSLPPSLSLSISLSLSYSLSLTSLLPFTNKCRKCLLCWNNGALQFVAQGTLYRLPHRPILLPWL